MVRAQEGFFQVAASVETVFRVEELEVAGKMSIMKE